MEVLRSKERNTPKVILEVSVQKDLGFLDITELHWIRIHVEDHI